MNTQENPDIELAKACARGETWAQEKIYLDYSRNVFKVCRRILGSIETAEDVSQEVFIQIYSKIYAFKGTSRLSTWIHRVAANQALMHLRKNKTNRVDSIDDVEFSRLPKTLHSEKALNAAVSDRRLLNEVIEKLPPGYKKVFLLHDALELEHEEVARLLKCSVGTSKSQLHKARLKLRDLIRKEERLPFPAWSV